MTAALRAEWLKLTTTQTFRRVLLASAGFGVLAAFAGTAQGPPPWHITEPLRLGASWGMASMLITAVAMVVGTRVVTDEFTHGTIVHTFIADPRRRRSMLAKATVAGAAGALLGAMTAAVIAVAIYAIVATSGGPVTTYASDLWGPLALAGAGAAMAVLGMAVGSFVRQQLAAALGCLVWVFAAENVAGILLGPVARYLPGKVATAAAVLPSAGEAALAAAALGIYAALGALAAVVAMRGRDVL